MEGNITQVEYDVYKDLLDNMLMDAFDESLKKTEVK